MIAADTFNYKAADFNCYSFLEERESLKKMTFRTIVAEHNRRIGKFLKYLTFLKAMLITQLLTIIIIVLCYPTNSHWWSGRRKEDHCLWVGKKLINMGMEVEVGEMVRVRTGGGIYKGKVIGIGKESMKLHFIGVLPRI